MPPQKTRLGRAAWYLLITTSSLSSPIVAQAGVPVTDCSDFRALGSDQICLGAERTWHLTGDDTVIAYPFEITLNGDTLEFTATATAGNPDGIVKFYLISGDMFLLPLFQRTGYPDQILGPYNYSEAGTPIVLGPAELARLFDWQANANGVVLIEQHSDDTIDDVASYEAFVGLTLSGTAPVVPPTSITATSSANVINSCSVADPINTYTGELIEFPTPDLDLSGPMPLRFSRYYASGLKAANISGTMGDNWRHDFEWQLYSNDTVIDVVSARGRLIRFTQSNGQWQLDGRQDIPYQLVEDVSTGEFVLADPSSDRSYRFSAAGQLLTIDDNRGNTHTLAYDAGGLLLSVSDGLGRLLNLTYDANNRVTGVNDGQGRAVSFTYSGNDLAGFTDADGNTTTYSYTSGGLLTAVTRPTGNVPHTQSWGGDGRVTAQTDALGNTTRFDYNGTTSTVTAATGEELTLIHTASGALEQIVREDGTGLTISSDSAERRGSITDSQGAATGYTYHAASGKIASINHADGTTTSFAYSERLTSDGITLYDLTKVTHADGSTESFSYDANGGLVAYTDQAGHRWDYTYDDNGRLLTVTTPGGGVVSRSHNTDGTLASRTDASGNITAYTYDDLRRPITVTFADNTMMAASYDAMDRLLGLTDPRGNRTTYVWDANGNLASLTDRSGAIFTYVYDAMDRPTSVTDVNGNTSTLSYDPRGRIASLTDPNGNDVTFTYDAAGRLTELTDGNGNTWKWRYDGEDIPTGTTTPLGNTTTFTADERGRIDTITPPLGNTTTFSYDAMGRVTGITDPLGETTTRGYDAAGRLTGITLPANIGASYTYDALGNLTTITDPNGNTWTRNHDQAGRLTQTTDPLNRSKTLAYDSRNRAASVSYPGDLGSLSNTYDANGNLVRRQYSDGTDLTYSYDAEDRLLTADGITLTRDTLGRITASNGVGIAYDAGGRITAITYTGGKTITYGYDGNDNLTRVSDWVGGTSTFTWDADGRLTTMTRPNGITTTYTYDADGRLIGIAHGGLGNIRLTRDANGRITAATRDLPQAASAAEIDDIERSYDTAGQISGAGYSYDALGRLTSDGATTFVWDLASRLTRAGDASHTYDALGQRLSRTVNGNTRNYVWNQALGLPSVAIERDGSGTDLRYHVHAPDGALLYSIDAATDARRFYHFDEAGNTRFVTDDAGVVIAAYAHTPFGVLLASSGTLDNPFTWQGQWGIYDDGNGLYYIRARYYDARDGRFLSRDPLHLKVEVSPGDSAGLRGATSTTPPDTMQTLLGNPPSVGMNGERLNPLALNPYAFANLNPMYFHDPNGESVTIIVVGGALVAAGTALYKLGQWVDRVFEEQEAVRENARALDDPTLPFRHQNKIISEELPDEAADLCAAISGTTATGPVHGAPVSDTAQFATQTAITATGLDKPPGAQSEGNFLTRAWNYWFGS